jgi:hypothetical protein
MTGRKVFTDETKLFLIYTFSISWFFWLIIIIAIESLLHFGMENS